MKTVLTVVPLEGEADVFLVQSESRPDIQHRVEMTPKPVCGCEQVQAKGKSTCKHIEAVRRFTQEQTKPDYTEKEFEP